jgi:antitoxin component of RelBE/YafQ-DinJ toxin-antitoxin module|nr:MAG TPA: antitoxin [Caudoviricetes sp.]
MKGLICMADIKTEVIRLRVTKQLKEDFQTKCKKFSINSSDLIRNWIEKYTYDNEYKQ